MNNTFNDFDTQIQCEELYTGITEMLENEYVRTMIELNVQSLNTNVYNN